MVPEGTRSSRPVVRWALLFAVALGAFLALAVTTVVTRHGGRDAEASGAPTTVEGAAAGTSVPAPAPEPAAAQPSAGQPVSARPERYRLSIVIKASFFNTFSDDEEVARIAQKTGIKKLADRLSAHVARNLVWSLDMRKEVYPGDVLDLVFRIVSAEEQQTRKDLPDEIEILAMRYRSVRLGKELRIYQFKASDWPFPAYYYADGTRVEPMMKSAPIKEWTQITSLLRDRRPRHDGIDFKAPVGTPVYAPWSGVVERVNWKVRYNGYSIAARLDTDPPLEMILLHLDKVHVKPGQRFTAGAHIADVGNTGRSFAPHLHYQLGRAGLGRKGLVDPFKHHGSVKARIPQGDEESFRKTVADLDRILSNGG